MSTGFLPSVSLRDDLRAPERLAHYRPTSRSVAVIGAVLGRGATMVIASYGSGKSLAAGLGALAVDNDPANRSQLREAADLICNVDADVATEFAERIAVAPRGRYVVLSGYVPDLPGAIAEALGLPASGDLDTVLAATARTWPQDLALTADLLAIVWDEFGRHLEGLVREGRTRDLDQIQRLAEWSSRSTKPHASLTLLMHQNLLAYAGSLNQTTRNEWRKVEGRFRTLRFVEDSREFHRLVADVIVQRERKTDDIGHIPGAVDDVIRLGWLDGMSDPVKVESLLVDAHPLSAAALHVLPGLVARVGQNERSLFSFLESADLDAPVGMDELVTAFSDAMASDVGIGGTHRRWIEAQSALSKAHDPVEREIICACLLMRLGRNGESRHLTRDGLAAAVRSKGVPAPEVDRAIDALVSRKLVLFRKLTGDVSLWHGVDVDVAGRLRGEIARRSLDFNLLDFLAAQHPAPFLRPIRHNMQRGTMRYMVGDYIRASALSQLPAELPTGCWGRIVYVICESADDIASATAFATSNGATLERTILVVPRSPKGYDDAALEIEALDALRRDDTLLAEDPLVGREIDELLVVARRHLTMLMHDLTAPRSGGAIWWAGGRDLGVGPDGPAAVAVSALMDDWYPLTPVIANDQLMRGTISSQMRTFRVRTVLRLMERSHLPAIGYPADGSAESSLYRTVLARTGLHVDDGKEARFAAPEEIEDPGLRHVWETVRAFFVTPGRRTLYEIVAALSAPPVGLPMGVIPIIVMAGYRAFGRAVTIRTDGAFVSDVLGFASTRMFLEPERHEFEIHDNGEATLTYLSDFARIFGQPTPGPHDERLRYASNALQSWRAGIADGAIRSKRMPDSARCFLREVSRATDPAELILDAVPRDLGEGDLVATARKLEQVRDSIDGLVEGYLRDAVAVTGEVLTLEGTETGMPGIAAWLACLDVPALMRRTDVRMPDKAVLRTAREAVDGRGTPETFARAVSSVLLQRGIEKWQDDTREQLRKELREARNRIESAMLDSEDVPASFEPILDARIKSLQDRLARIRMTREAA